MLIQHSKKQEKDENIFQSVWEREKDIQEQKVEIKRRLFSTLAFSKQKCISKCLEWVGSELLKA